MKNAKLFLAFLITVMLCTVLLVIPASADEITVDPADILTYDGLQARTKGDYMGLRSLYTVDDELVRDLVKEGHTVQYGALMGVGTQRGISYLSLADMTVSVSETEISSDSSLAAVVVVYDSTGKYGATETYVSRGEIKSRFAFTTTYKPSAENALMLKETELIYRAFIIIDGEITYVDAVGANFGTEESTYGVAASLYEVAQYWSGVPAYTNTVAIRKVVASCMDDSFTAEFANGLTLTSSMSSAKATFENAKAGIYAVKYKYIPNAAQGAFYAIKSAESGHTASAKIPFDASETVKEPSWSVVTSYIYLAEGKNTLSFAGSGSQPALYGVELTLVEAMPVEDTSVLIPKGSNTTVTKVNASNDAGIKTYYGGNLVFLRANDYATHTLTVDATGLYDIYFAYNCGGANVQVTANGATVSGYVTQPFVLNWNGTNSALGNSSLSSSAAYMKISGVSLNEGENTVSVKMTGGFITYGTLIAVRKASTVTLYDADGTTALSTQKVYDISDVVYPTNIKIPAGYDDVAGWTPLTYNEETGCYESQIIYGKYYTVSFYDYDQTTLLSTMKIVAGSDNAGPDMSGDKTFKCWSTPLSEINADCSVYAVKKETSVSVSASDVVLASASFSKVAADATYSDFEGYYTVTATESAFVAGAVYTKDGDTYSLAFTDTGDTYYALAVTAKTVIGMIYTKSGNNYIPVTKDTYNASATNYSVTVAEKSAYDSKDSYVYKLAGDGSYVKCDEAEDGVAKYYKVTATKVATTNTEWFDPFANDYYTYTYTIADESPVKTVAASGADNFYTPATATTTDAIYFPNRSGILPSTTYVSVLVTVDYTGYYRVDIGTSKMYSHYPSIRNMTTEEQNPNVEAFMTNRTTGARISGTKVTGNKANALFATASKAYTMGWLYLAEGVNEIRLYHNYHSNNGTGSAFSTVDFTLVREHDVESSLAFEIITSKAGWAYNDGGNDTAYGSGTGHIRVQPQSTKNHNMPYDFLANKTLDTEKTAQVNNAAIPEGATLGTRSVTLKAGTYSLVEYINSSGHKISYTFTKADDASVSVTAGTSVSSANPGHSFCAFMEVAGPTVTIPEDGTYNVSVVATYANNYISFAMFHLVPVEGETHTVKFYDGDGNLLSIQAVADGTAAVAPDVDTEGFLGWSEDFSSVTADMEIYATYDIRYTVKYYDNEGELIATETVAKGDAATPPDYGDYKEFKGWSISPDEYVEADLSLVTGDVSVYLTMKKTSASVSASDAILASASFTKVAADATYSQYTGYYAITATESAFAAGAVYTKDGDTYNLALTDTGDTYYALSVTPILATAETTLTDYYTYTYTLADESPVKVTGSYAGEYYTPATSTTTDAIFLPAVGSSNYITLKVNADYSGSYLITFDYLLSNARAYSLGFKNVTTAAQNANIESFMTDTTMEGRINKTQSAANKAAFLYNEPTQTTGVGYIFLAEGVNYVKIYNASNGSSSTGIAVSDFGFELAGEHVPGTVILTPKDADGKNWWQHASYKSEAFENTFMDALSVGSLEPGTYTLYAMVIGSNGGKFEFTLNDQTQTFTLGANASYTASSVEDFESGRLTAIGGKSTGAWTELPVATFTITEAGEYTLTGKTTWRNNYIGFYRCRLVPVEVDTHTVTFTDTDGSILAKQTVVSGTAAVAPDMTGDAGFLRWNTDFTSVTGDLTVTAVRNHTVTFRDYTGAVIATRTTVTGGTVIAPDAPLRDGYYFVGWNKDFSVVNGDMSVRAVYAEKERFTVSFVDRNGATLDTQTVYTGDAATPPAYTAPDGYIFLGWSADTSAVFDNMTVTARTAQKTLTGENLVGTNTTTVAAGEGTLETVFLPVGDENYITFNVTADIAGYYRLNLQMNHGGALLNYVRVKNTSVTTYEKDYYGVGRVNAGSSKASVTVETCMVAEGTAYTNDVLHVYLHEGENTLRLSTNGGKSVGVAGITLTLESGTALDGDYYAIYDKNSWIAAESDVSSYDGMSSGNDGQTGGILLRKNRYITLSETLTIAEDGYYSLHGVMAANGAIVTLTDVSDPENVIVFNAASLGDKGGTASSAFWHGTRGTQNIYAGTYKVKIYSLGNHVFTAYYLERKGELDGVYNVNTENATLGEGATLLGNAASVLLPGTEAGYVELPVTADRDGLFRVTLAASTAGAEIGALYATVNGGRIYTLSPATFGSAGDGYLNTEFNDEEDSVFYLPLVKGENTVRFYTANGEKIAISGARFFYAGSAADSTPYTGEALTVAGTSGTTSVLGAGTATKNADHMYLASTLYSGGGIATYTFTVDSPRSVYFNVNMEASLGSVILYTLKDSAGNTLKDTFYAVNHDTVGVECVNLDLFDFPAAGEYTLTVSLRRSQTNHKDSAANSLESSEIGAKVELRIYSIVFANFAQSLLPPDTESGDVTHSSATDAIVLGTGASMTFNNVSLRNNASYALRILGRVSPDAVVTVSYTGAGSILESDYFYDQLFKVTAVTEIPENNTTVYEYDTRTGRYVLATEYNEGTVYYLKSGTVTPSTGSVTFTASEAITATQWIKLGNLNLLADTYTVTVTVTAGSIVVDDMLLVRTADYLHVIELDRSEISTTDDNEVRTAVLSDNHYVHGNLGGYSDLERQYLMMEMLLAEYNTAESLDAVFLAGDLGNFRLNAETTIDNGKVYHYSMTYLIENILRQMADTGLPFFATHSGHDYASSEMWYDLFGYEKNYVVVIDGAAYVCFDFYYDQADHKAHEPAAAQVDISDEVRDQILAVLDRDDIEYASIVIHYGTNSLPNMNKIAAHPKMKVAFGGHTHDNTTQLQVGTALSHSAMGSGGLLFLQHAHFSIISGYDTGGKTLHDPIINLTNEGYYQVYSGVSVNGEVYKTLSEIGLEYANSHETTKLASGSYSRSGKWQTAAYTTDGKKIIFFRNEVPVASKEYAQIAYNYYVIDGDNVYAADLSAAVNETFVVSYTGAEATDKSIAGLVFGVDYFKVGVASGSDVILFAADLDTESGNYNVTTTGKTYYLVNGDGSLSLLSGVSVAPHAVAAENRVISETNTYNNKTVMGYEVSGCPWGMRILERVNGTETDIVESYFVYGGYAFDGTYLGYMRIRPSDMAGYIDHLYTIVDVIEKD